MSPPESPPEQPVLRQTLSQQIRDTLVRQIVSGELAPGERLVETRVAATFGTSQAPVREALRELETFGLVEIRPRRGTFVRSFVRETLRESYVLRAALEEAATRLVLMTGNVPVDALRDDVDRMRRAARIADVESVGLQTVQFHRHIVEAAGNDLIKRCWDNLHIEARTSVTMMAATPDLFEIADDHQRLLDSLDDTAIDAACTLAREHQWNYAQMPEHMTAD
ncbi:GntR family transcriptional regulator [Mycobacterium sp. WMMD1722]|uniref:GntR family transcriptional regulator n=1 Tax=Mycobacterium sp. WMMD1722 TaxID=3404117 RepID=UPI003BF5B5DE